MLSQFAAFLMTGLMAMGQWGISPVSQKPNRAEIASQSALVMVLCENGKTPFARFMEEGGKVLLNPLLKSSYKTRIWLVGNDATPQRFLQAVRQAAKTHNIVDIMIFAHGKPGYIRLAQRKRLTSKMIVKGLKGRGGEKVRMMYLSCCYSNSLLPAWKKAGFRSIRGHSGVYRPLGFPLFLIGWLKGDTYQEACRSEYRMNARLHRIYNQNAPQIRRLLRQYKRFLRGIRPQSKMESKLLSFGWDFYRIARNWTRHRRWKIKESYPIVRGDKKVRITSPRQIKSTSAPGSGR